MKVILIPDETSGQSSRSLSPGQVKLAVVGISGALALSIAASAVFGTVAWNKTRQLDQIEIARAEAEQFERRSVQSEEHAADTASGDSQHPLATATNSAVGNSETAVNSTVTASSTPSRTLVSIESKQTLASTLEAVAATDEDEDRVLIVARSIANIRHDLSSYRDAIRDVRNENDTHLSVLGARIGQLQAHVQRLNALGTRLTDVANLASGEFNFDQEPAIGGADQEDASESVLSSSDALLSTLDRLDGDLARNDSQLEVLEALIRDQKLERARYPAAWPTDGGWVSSNFGKRRDPFSGRRSMHKGMDIAARHGSTIRAAAAGVVTHTGHTGNYGLMVEINHGNGYTTRYGHASKILVKVGEKVDKGGAIAKMGSTGRSTGPHLHFEVIENAKHVDPRKFLGTSG